MRNPMDLTGRHIMVTGAAQGIGLAIARLALELGARVSLVDANGGALAGRTTSWSEFHFTLWRFWAMVRPVTVMQSPCR